jgi:hypothetical protein
MLRRAVARPVVLIVAAAAVCLTAWLTGRSDRCTFTCAPNLPPQTAPVAADMAITFNAPVAEKVAAFTDSDLR